MFVNNVSTIQSESIKSSELERSLEVNKLTSTTSDSEQGFPKRLNKLSKDRYKKVFQRKDYRPAIYGLSQPQRKLGYLTCKLNELEGVDNRTIALLNKKLDNIVHYDREENPKWLIQQFKDHITALDNINTTDKEVKAWGEYLKLNSDKLDPFLKLNKALSKTNSYEEQVKIVTNFCYKNTSGDSDVNALTETILNLILKSKVKSILDVDQYALPHMIQVDFAEMFVKHFFRNTSKLGLEFFSDNNIDIIFSWEDGQSGSLDLRVIQDKKWQSNEHRFGDKYEPITFSEIRHVLRNPERFKDKVFKVHVHDIKTSTFSFSESLESETWQDVSLGKAP